MKIRHTVTLGLALLFAATAIQVKAGPIVYASASNSTVGLSLFGTLDLATGVFTGAPSSIDYTALTSGPGGLYGASTQLYTVGASGSGTPFGTLSVGPGHFWGLASQGASGFFATTRTPGVYTFWHISADGTSMTALPATANTLGAATGTLAFGPGGNLYFNAVVTAGSSVLFTVDLSTGALTQIGSGLGSATDLTLTMADGVLYGVDTVTVQNPTIYSINTATGMATAIGVVSGLPQGFTLDAMASVPEPATVVLGLFGLCAIWAGRRRR